MDKEELRKRIGQSLVEQAANIDIAFDKLYPEYQRIYSTVINNPKERHPKLWGKYLKVTIEKHFNIPVSERGLDWIVTLSTIIAISERQAFIESGLAMACFDIGKDIGVRKESKKLDRKDLTAIATEDGIKSSNINASKSNKIQTTKQSS